MGEDAGAAVATRGRGTVRGTSHHNCIVETGRVSAAGPPPMGEVFSETRWGSWVGPDSFQMAPPLIRFGLPGKGQRIWRPLLGEVHLRV